jgi:NAD(P)H-dependent flavin oxidoreductase YrpB (nitropropane dioxygenase family)
MGSRTVKVVLTNRRLAILPSKAGVLGILKGNYMSALKSGGSHEEIILPLNAIKEVKTNNFGGGINVVTADKKYTLDFKALNGFWQKDIKQAFEASK